MPTLLHGRSWGLGWFGWCCVLAGILASLAAYQYSVGRHCRLRRVFHSDSFFGLGKNHLMSAWFIPTIDTLGGFMRTSTCCGR